MIPAGQTNAALGDGLVMRVGIPHTGGRLAFHAFERGYPVMVSANAFWRGARGFKFPDATNLSELDFALDSAGFTAMKLWQSKGRQPGMAGIFPWSYSQYLEFANLSGCSWYSQPDLCCEPEIAASQADIDFRVNATATLLEGCLRIVYDWQNELAKTSPGSVAASMVRPPVPVLQGWSAGDYRRSLDLLLEVWRRWEPWLAAPALIGVGSVCRRSLTHPTHGLYPILAALEGSLPAGSRLHLFGVKGACLSEVRGFGRVASADSMAYDFGARMEARRAGVSNSVAHRSAEMTKWMSAARRRLDPSPGEQLRLGLFA